MKKAFASFILLFLIIGSTALASGPDWVRWRGPDADGIFRGINWNPKALDSGVDYVWKSQIGIGFSAVSIQGNRLYTMGNKNGNDIIFCLDANTGRVIWKHTYACEQGGWPGPRATPTIDGDRVYTLSRSGHIHCLNTTSGKIIWKRDLIAEGMAVDPDCGISGSPLVVGNAIILNAGKTGISLNKMTGKVNWHSGAEKCGFAAPVLYRSGGKTKLAILGRTVLYGVNIQDGKVLWSMPWKTRYEENSPDPIAMGSQLFVSTGYGRDCALLDLKSGSPNVVWQNRNMSNHFHTSILLNGHIYGIDGVAGKKCNLRCVDAKTGDIEWEVPFEFGPIMATEDKLLVLTEKGMLHIADASPNGYKEISKAQVITIPDVQRGPRTKRNFCWTPPVLSNGRMYVRSSHGELVCINMN